MNLFQKSCKNFSYQGQKLVLEKMAETSRMTLNDICQKNCYHLYHSQKIHKQKTFEKSSSDIAIENFKKTCLQSFTITLN